MNAVVGNDFRSRVSAFSKMLKQREKMTIASLPSHVPYDRFERSVIVAIQKNPDLVMKCSPESLLLACSQAAADGLLPDGREGAIIPYKTEAKWSPMVGGFMKLARNSGQIASLTANVVFEGEHFTVMLGDEERIEHTRDLSKTGGKVVAAYAVARLKDGSDPIREVMSHQQLMKVRNVNKGWSYGPWKEWEDEMSRAKVMRRLVKRLPLSTDKEADRFVQAVSRYDDLEVIDHEPKQRAISTPEDDFTAAAMGQPQIAAPSLIEQLTSARTLEDVQELEPVVNEAMDQAEDSAQSQELADALENALNRVGNMQLEGAAA